MAPPSSTLAWRIPWTQEPGRVQSVGSLRVGHDWATSLSLFTFMHWRRKWQPTPVFLPGESQGQGNLVGCRLWGHTELDIGKDWCWEGLGAGGEGDDRGWDGWMASLTQWMWVWVNTGSWWWTGRPGVLQFMGSQRVRHNWVTELKHKKWVQKIRTAKSWNHRLSARGGKVNNKERNEYIIHPTTSQEIWESSLYCRPWRAPSEGSIRGEMRRGGTTEGWALSAAFESFCATKWTPGCTMQLFPISTPADSDGVKPHSDPKA